MPGHIIAAQLARESTRRRIAESPPERRRRRRRAAAARVLRAAANRLDPALAPGYETTMPRR
jgi:hypothetical protein